jgi:DNA repair exonuclease SbcCD ATPase subunit
MKTWLFIIILMGSIAGGVGYYYNTTQARLQAYAEANAALQANNQRLLETNQINVSTIDQLNVAYEEVTNNYNQVLSEFQVIRMQNDELRQRLGRHELGSLAAARPELVERTINRATVNVLRCFEVMSGSPLNNRELTASNPREANAECPWLFEDLRR